MEYEIRHIRPEEWPLLADFLLGAIYVPEGFEGTLERSVVYEDPKCLAAFEGFGSLADDRCFVAEASGEVVGACWVRTTDEYGHIDDMTPSFAISVLEPWRDKGIGTSLMRALLTELREAGYVRASLSVQKENPALALYERLGFRIVGYGVDETEWLMVARLDQPQKCASLEFVRMGMGGIEKFSELRIAQLLEEGAKEVFDLRPALYDHYRRHLTDGSFRAWMCMHDGEIVGTGGVSIVEKPPYFGCPSGRIGLISSMYVVPKYRRGGIARDLLLRIADEARGLGCGVLQITASDAGTHLYGACGFVRNQNFMQLTL